MARQKESALIISFASTTDAIGAESFCRENGLPGRIVPLPREVSAGCGLAWKAKPEEKKLLERAFKEKRLNFSGFHFIDFYI